MAKKRKMCYSGIGGQAVLEGIMMKNGEKYAVAVRKPDGSIAVDLQEFRGMQQGKKFRELPFIRGVFNFVDSLTLGMKSLNFSASFYEEEEEALEQKKRAKEKEEKLMTTFVAILSVCMAVGIFIVLPYFISSLVASQLRNRSLVLLIEGAIRIVIFLLYVWGISAMKDIKRLYQYHGAEHKCINCIERGRELNIKNIKRCSRLHKRCGTSFIFFVLFVSIILSFFIVVENPFLKVLLRVLMMPIVAGISYEIIRLAGRSNNAFIQLLSLPGMAVQRITTREPDEKMIEVAITAIEAVFDWRAYLAENFGYYQEESVDSSEEI